MKPLRITMLGPSLSQNGGIASVENLILKYAPADIQIDHIATHEDGSVIQRVRIFVKAVGRLIQQLLMGNADIFHLHVSQRGSAFRVAILVVLILLFQKPIVLHPHGSEFRLFYSNLHPSQKWLLRSVFRRCNHFVVLSESWKKFYIDIFALSPQQVSVLANPVKLPFALPKRHQAEETVFLFLGRIGDRKGAFDLIQAFSNVYNQQLSNIKLVLAGDGELDRAQQLIESLQLTNQVCLLGWVDIEQRDQLLAEASVFVLPSYNEGLPMALLEAMGWELPVITTPVGGIPELIVHSENGLLVTPGNLSELAEMMQSLIQSESFRRSLGSKARASVLPLGVEHYCSTLVETYQKVLKPY